MSDWPTSAQIDEMPDDILRQWFWRPIPAMTQEQQATIRRAANRLYSPPKIAPVYIPALAQKTAAEKPQLSPKSKAEEPASQQDSLDLFKTLFRKP